MAPVTHCAVGDISLFPRSTFIPRKDIQLRNYNISGKYSRLTSYSPRILIPQSSLGLFQFYRSSCSSKHRSRIRIVAAVGTDVTVEEQNPAVLGEVADEALESPPSSVETSEITPANASIITTPIRNKRSRPIRKSDMPPVKDEELVQGATFTGKVRSIQPFGAFIDIGAYTEGLVHVSRMSDGYVKDVNDLVSVGQEVEVRIVDVNKESGRISLSMRTSDDSSRPQQRKDPSASESSDKSRPPRKNAVRSNQKRDDFQKNSKFVKGQTLDGTVKNQNRAGAFVSLPDGEEGFLPVSEESEGFDSLLGNSSLQVGQEINVRVLRFSRGKLTLTMKKEEDAERFNKEFNQGVVHVATNPFELAFRRNKDIASFLEVREKAQKASEGLIGEKVIETIPESNNVDADGSTASANEDEVKNSAASAVVLEDEEIRSLQLNPDAVLESSPEVEEIPSSLGSDEASMLDDSKSISGASAPTEIVEEQVDRSQSFISEEMESTSSGKDEPSMTHGDEKEDKDIKAVEENEKAQVSESLVIDQLSITEEVKATEVTTSEQDESSSIILGTEDIGPSGKSTQVGDSSTVEETNSGSQFISSQPDDKLANEAALSETLLPVENEKAPDDAMDVKAKAPENENGQTGVTEQGSAIKATISPTLVKQLRDETGAGMMDCKKALTETDGDIVKAQEFLRKKGLASADKKASRATAEGRVGSYIHDNRIGVLIEVNCETDFVSRGDIFKGLVDDLAMQVAACPQVRYLTTEDVPEEFVNKEREIELQKEDLLNKPEQIRSKIVDGRIRKRLEEISLLEQPYIKNDKMVVKDLVKQTIATIGENMKVKRFIRYNLGEGLERKSQDFAAEVAAQTAAKAPPATPKEQTSETVESVEKPPTIAVSAALVKQLREETGAGMMDCKKALTETEGDLEKAQEYLRTKGLSSADKKSSRLAAEGRISSYIHDARIGTLVEVNCETDFVARNEKFKELVDDLAMQVVASPQVEFVSVEEIPESIVKKEKEIEMQREDLNSKPEHIREKIVEGRISKRLGELALLEQPFIKDDSLLVKDLVKQTVAALGENVRVRRFVRYTLGEDKD